MRHPRLHNILAALTAGIVLGVTAWSLYAREPGVFHVEAKQMRKAPPPAENVVKESQITSQETKTPATEAPKNQIEQMIQRGQLSKHPARFYNKEP